MINDILFSLLGFTGGIYIDNGDSFIINETIDSITNSEKEILKRIGEIGFKYKILKDFVKNYKDLFTQNLISGGNIGNVEIPELNEENLNLENNEQISIDTSIYLSPIVDSLQDFLKTYEEKVFTLENKYYRDLNLTGSEIISTLKNYLNIFDKIYEFLQFVTQKNLKGGEFLNFLYESTITGDPEVKKVFKNLFITCNKMLINFITIWIINGQITSNEFFIISVNNFIVKEEGIINKFSANFQMENYNKNELESWNANFYIEFNNIPNYIPHNLVEDILFVGKAIKILNSNKNSDEDKIPFNEISIFYTTLQKLNEVAFNEDEDVVNLINIELVMKIITLIKNCSAKYLWKLVVTKKGFFDHLNAVKNIFLTFNGEFFYNFTNKIKTLLNLPFDKKIENEINEVYFKNAMKEVFNIDTDQSNEKLYSNFNIKLISSGFNYNFETQNVKNYVDKKEISFLGSINFDQYSNSLRFMNTTYKTLPGALWNMTSFDLDEEFAMSNSFLIKNFTKPKGIISDINSNTSYSNINSPRLPLISPRLGSVNKVYENDLLRSSHIKMKGKNEMNEEISQNNLERKIVLNYIMHSSKNFEYKNSQPLNLNDLFHFFNFQFTFVYENAGNNNNNINRGNNFNFINRNNLNHSTFKVKSFIFSLKYVNKIKKIILNSDKNNFLQLNENEIEIFSKTITTNTDEFLDFIQNDQFNNIQINFKDNFCTIFNSNNSINFSFPLTINQFIPKDKRKMTIGLILTSENLDVILDITSWNFNFFSGEIYNENSNLILINYSPTWPHNFLFNENILKMYNLIFNLIFPLKTNLTLLNQLWIDKKNLAKKENFLFRLIDSVHSEFVCFLQNLISFYMFDLVDLKFKQFYNKIKDCQDFEKIIISHEEFLGEVISNSFVKSKKIMRLVFDILFTTRKFYNFVENFLANLNSLKAESENDSDIYNKEQYEILKVNLMGIKEEFNIKVKNLIFMFTKIKNSKYFTIISQLLTKLDYHLQISD